MTLVEKPRLISQKQLSIVTQTVKQNGNEPSFFFPAALFTKSFKINTSTKY